MTLTPTTAATPTSSGTHGYAHEAYARSFTDPWTPRPLPRSGGWLLEREVPGGGQGRRDAMGTYPLLWCHDWRGLAADLDELESRSDLVSVAAVTDPLGDLDGARLHDAFPDIARPFKEHFVADLAEDPSGFVIPRHRAKARRALERVSVTAVAEPWTTAASWLELYADLVARRGIRGVADFAPATLVAQLAVPGVLVLRADAEERAVAMTIWYSDGDRAYYHLGASNDEGYAAGASYALMWTALHELRASGVRWADFGAGAGVGGNGTDGLARFKQGWANTTRTAWFCGRILDRARYAAASRAAGVPAGVGWFPAYRWQEASR